MPSPNPLPLLIHFGLVHAAFYLLLSFVLGHYGVVFRAILAAVLACPTFVPREWIFFIFALQDQIEDCLQQIALHMPLRDYLPFFFSIGLLCGTLHLFIKAFLGHYGFLVQASLVVLVLSNPFTKDWIASIISLQERIARGAAPIAAASPFLGPTLIKHGIPQGRVLLVLGFVCDPTLNVTCIPLFQVEWKMGYLGSWNTYTVEFFWQL
ncbi:hypothetical protein MBLNU13_g03534t1 [Cladosporium sp. NU13]